MTQARAVFPGHVLLIMSTTLQRMFLLKPDPVVNQTLLYCLFRAGRYRDGPSLVTCLLIGWQGIQKTRTDRP